MTEERDIEAMVPLDDGVLVRTVTTGRGPTPVVLCHGGAGLWDYLEPVAEILAPIARVYRSEQRGCGRSQRAGPYTISRYLADLELLREHHGHERWLVAGHSWGAGLALRYALAQPQRTLGVLYISGTGVGHAWRDAYHREAARRLDATQRARHEALTKSERSAAEEHEWRVLSYAPDVGDPARAFAIAAAFADVPHAINHGCNRALNDEEAQHELAREHGFDNRRELVRRFQNRELEGVERALMLADHAALAQIVRAQPEAASARVADLPALIALLRRSTGSDVDVHKCARLLLDSTGGLRP